MQKRIMCSIWMIKTFAIWLLKNQQQKEQKTQAFFFFLASSPVIILHLQNQTEFFWDRYATQSAFFFSKIEFELDFKKVSSMNTVLLLLIFIFIISPKNCRAGRIHVTARLCRVPFLCVSVQSRIFTHFVFWLLSRREDGSTLSVLGLERQGQLPPICCRGAVSLSESFPRLQKSKSTWLEHEIVSKLCEVTSDTPFSCQRYSHTASPVLML